MTLTKAFLGEWRITEAELWDREDLDLVTPATLSLKPHGGGHIALIATEAQLDYRVVTRDGLPAVEVSFHGFNEGDQVVGRGWAVLKGEELDGRLFFHQGDDSCSHGRDRHQRGRLAEQLRRREMNRVERANGFDGTRPSDSSEHGVCDSDDVAARTTTSATCMTL